MHTNIRVISQFFPRQNCENILANFGGKWQFSSTFRPAKSKIPSILRVSDTSRSDLSEILNPIQAKSPKIPCLGRQMGHFPPLPDLLCQKLFPFSAFRAIPHLIQVKSENRFLDFKMTWAGKIDLFSSNPNAGCYRGR